jgi:hypothetical protein
MSRRDQLVQQNIARARSKPEAPAQQESAGKQFLGGGGGAGGPKSFFGGNFDVYSRLESIGFDKRPGGDASMRGGVAYIRIWRRGGMAASSQTTVAFSDVPSIDFQTALRTDLSSLFGPNQLTLGEDFASGFAGQSLSNTPFPTTPNLPITQSLLNRQKDLGKQTPGASPGTGLAAANIFGNQIVAQTPFTPFSLQNRFRPSPFLQSPSVFGSSAFVPTSALGNVVSANPNGLVSTLSGIALSSLLRPAGFRQSYPSYLMGPRRPSPPYLGQAQAPKNSSSGGLQGEMMWQFLFNPSELELDAGPEFKSAETWAVSDKANSGQPLHWSHNKNAQLKFNSVLLNGFVFGRKVEELEQGLIELFMARDGVGQHGPHVLEFVWGKRTFGPCVIKSIVVKEKMWDEGEVVNAELSFTLEQVPEWTINDGAYVDIARPGRQPLQEDVGRPVSGAQGATEAAAGAPSPAPGGGSSSDQKPPTSAPPDQNANLNLRAKCTNLGRAINNLKSIQSSPNFLGISQQNPAQAQERLRLYTVFYNYAQINQITPINVGLATPDNIEKVINEQWDRNSQGQTRSGRLQTRYPTTSANNVISQGTSFLIGNLETQVASTTCVNALR